MAIECPITVNKINQFEPHSLYKPGGLAKVRPCGEEYKGKTFLGFFLGELPQAPFVVYHQDAKELDVGTMSNPAIFVPALDRIVWGCESWWSRIENESDLKDITDSDIENCWYVKAFREFQKKTEPKSKKQKEEETI